MENENSQLKAQNTMSLTEHFTGEYYLDGKPIYEKTIYVQTLANKSGRTQYNNGIENVENIWYDTSKCCVGTDRKCNAGICYIKIY